MEAFKMKIIYFWVYVNGKKFAYCADDYNRAIAIARANNGIVVEKTVKK